MLLELLSTYYQPFYLGLIVLGKVHWTRLSCGWQCCCLAILSLWWLVKYDTCIRKIMFQILYDAWKFNEYPKILFSLAKFSQKLLQNIMTMFCEITSTLNEQLISFKSLSRSDAWYWHKSRSINVLVAVMAYCPTTPSPDQATSHYLNQCWNIVNWTIGNKVQWNLNRTLCIFVLENAFEIVVWKLAAILSRPQCVNPLSVDPVYIHVYIWNPHLFILCLQMS